MYGHHPPRSDSSISSDGDENEDINHLGFVNSPNVKKPLTKNYMAPTISAASKAIAPRKKILAERSDAPEPASFDVDNRKNSVLDDSGFSLEEEKFPQKSVEPYDPETNFLSPRPKFLRYKPDRRREIFEDEEEEEAGNEESEDESITRSGSSSPSSSFVAEENSGQKDGVEIPSSGTVSDEFEVEEDEQEEEEKLWNTEGGLITVLLLLALGFSAMLITALNCSRPFCGLVFNKGTEGNFHETKNNSLEAFLVKNSDTRNVFSHQQILVTNRDLEPVFSEDSGTVDFKLQEVSDSEKAFVTEIVIVEEALDQVVSDSESQEGCDTDEKIEDSQDHEEVSSSQKQLVADSESQGHDTDERIVDSLSPVEKVNYFGEIYENVAAKLGENLRRIEAEFAVKVLMAVVTILSAVSYFFLGVESTPEKVKPRSSSSRTKSDPESLKEKYAENAQTEEAQYFSSEENTEEYPQSHAPSVSFLGELVMRDIERSVKKNQETESRLRRLESPLMDSSKLGSFSSSSKDRRDGEESFMTTPSRRSSKNGESASSTTPVRRSSRIRNRSVMSP